MAGLSDLFGGSPEQQGLMAAIAQIAHASGPQRTPQGLYSILGGGMMAGQQVAQQAREQAQVNQLREFAIKDKRSDYEAQELQRQRARELETLRSSYFKTGGAAATSMPAPKSADTLFRSALAGQEVGPPQALPAPASGGGLDRSAMVQQRLAYAQFLRENGRGDAAQLEEDAALKLQPKVKEWQKVQDGGKVLYAPYFEDGTSGRPVPLEVAEKLDSINRGGSTDLVNPYTGSTVRSLKNSASPDAQLSAGTAANRLKFDREQAGKPVFSAEAGGWVLPPSQSNPGGKLMPVAGIAGKAPTEFQGKAASFALRMGEADKIIRGLEGQYNPAAINSKRAVEDAWLVGGALGAGVNKFFMSESDQKAEQAERDWINANLRQESGAVIGKDEFDNARRQYFPQPGDSQAVIAQKARNRQLAEQGMRTNAGRAAMTAQPPAGNGITFLGFE